jgi:hypothetical protein
MKDIDTRLQLVKGLDLFFLKKLDLLRFNQ